MRSAIAQARVTDGTHVGASSRLDAPIVARRQGRTDRAGMGSAIAHPAVTAAMAAAGTEVTVEQLISQSLRRCLVPKA